MITKRKDDKIIENTFQKTNKKNKNKMETHSINIGKRKSGSFHFGDKDFP